MEPKKVSYAPTNDVRMAVAKFTDSVLQDVIRKAKKISVHSRKRKLTVSDIEVVLKNDNYYSMMRPLFGMDFFNFKKCCHATDTNNEGKILRVTDVIDANIPEIPEETSFSISWFVVNGEQVNYISDFEKEELKNSNYENENIQCRDRSIHNLSFECELFLKNIELRMSDNEDYLKYQLYSQLQTDQGLKQICPYLIHWIQKEVQSIVRTHHENMLSYLDYLMHITYSLINNPTLSIVLYLHVILPSVLTCCVGNCLSFSQNENHWSLRSFSAHVISEIHKKFGNEYPKMVTQIVNTLSKVLHNPKSTLPAIFGVIECITEMGENMIKTVLLPLYKEIIQNLVAIADSNPDSIIQNQVYRCLFAVCESIGVLWNQLQIEIKSNVMLTGYEQNIQDVISMLPPTCQLRLTEAVLPMCYQHTAEVWDICDYVI